MSLKKMKRVEILLSPPSHISFYTKRRITTLPNPSLSSPRMLSIDSSNPLSCKTRNKNPQPNKVDDDASVQPSSSSSSSSSRLIPLIYSTSSARSPSQNKPKQKKSSPASPPAKIQTRVPNCLADSGSVSITFFWKSPIDALTFTAS